MNLKHSLLAIAMSTVFVSQVQAADAAKQAVVDSLASNLVVKYEVVTNDGAGAGLDCQALGSEWASCGVAKLHLTNTGAAVIAYGALGTSKAITTGDTASFAAGDLDITLTATT